MSRMRLLTYSVRGTISGCNRFNLSTNRSCESFNLPAQLAHPEPRRRVVGATDPRDYPDLAPHPDFIRGPRVFADNLDFIIDPGQLRPEFFGGHPPRIQFGPPPDRLPFARGEVRIHPNAPKGFSSPQPACPYSGGRQGRRESPGNRRKERPFHHNGRIRLSAGCLSFRTADAFPDPSPPDSGASTTNRVPRPPSRRECRRPIRLLPQSCPATGLPIRRACGQRRGG